MGVRSRACGMLLALVASSLVLAGPAAGQQVTIIDYTGEPFSIFDPTLFDRPEAMEGQALASILPPFIYRPIDDLGARPGAMATGMGGAYTALAEGPLAMAWNPAGLGGLRGSQALADGFTLSSSGSADRLPPTVQIPGFGDFGISQYRSELGSVNGFGFFGAATPLLDLGGRPLVGGACYRRHTEVAFGEENLIEMNLLQTTSGFPLSLGIDNEERGFIESFTVGLGYDLIASSGLGLRAGATANLLSGRLRSSTLARVAVRNFEEGRGAFQRDYTGFSVELGAQARFASLVRVGGWVGLPHTIEVYNSRLSSLDIISPDQLLAVRYSWEIADYDMEVPLFASFGAALGPIRGIEVSADYHHRPWSEVEVTHPGEDFQQFDRPLPAADVSSYGLGTRFEFPLLRGFLRRHGMELTTLLGCRTMPLSMLEVDLDTGEPPFYRGDQVEGQATSFGFSLDTGRRVTLSVGIEMRSYEYQMWFLEDARELGTFDEPGREFWFPDEANRVMTVSRDDTILRFSSQMTF